jgi:hypothetical protein
MQHRPDRSLADEVAYFLTDANTQARPVGVRGVG